MDELLSSFLRVGAESRCSGQRVKVMGRKGSCRANCCSRLWFRETMVGEKEAGRGKGHFLEGQGCEGCCFRRTQWRVEGGNMSRDQDGDTDPAWMREEQEDVYWQDVRKKGLGWRVPPKTLEEESSLSPGWASLRRGGR